MATLEAIIYAIIIIAVRSTVNELLIREGQKLFGLSKVGTFKGSNSGECPACATMCLILDFGYTTFINPVDVLGKKRPN